MPASLTDPGVLLRSSRRHLSIGSPPMTPRSLPAIAVALVTLAGCGSQPEREAAAPRVIVPNEVLADLVERVACVEPVEATIGPDGDDGELPSPVLVVTLEEPTTIGDERLSIPAVATTIERPGPDDPWVWLDPTRFAEIARATGAALASSGQFDPELLDRCLARIDAEMESLDAELFEATQALTDERRIIDVSAPGTIYFASRYEFLPDESDTAVRAGRIMSTDALGGAESYDAMMRSNVDEIVEMLGSD
jgi:ABC-type Zn uptake system ZnuABC Zn-binding protein ZnuA